MIYELAYKLNEELLKNDLILKVKEKEEINKITIKHENELYTEYSSLSEATVQTGAKVKQGDVIGVSGVCEYDSTLKSHVYFKVMTGSKTFNPENVIGKTIEETLK